MRPNEQNQEQFDPAKYLRGMRAAGWKLQPVVDGRGRNEGIALLIPKHFKKDREALPIMHSTDRRLSSEMYSQNGSPIEVSEYFLSTLQWRVRIAWRVLCGSIKLPWGN